MHKNTLITIAEAIRERRKFLGITQEELAEICSISLRSLVDLENGKGNPTVEQLDKIINALGLELTIKIK